MRAVVVGAGISGASAAAYLKRAGHTVEIFESRPQLGGNCADEGAGDGTRLHIYGPHIFHTEDEQVWSFLNEYTSFNDYVHKVMANTTLGRIPIPFNKVSEEHTGPLTDDEIRKLLFVDYSEKMWGRQWDRLPEIITKRVPKRRNNRDCRYFTDKYQGIPSKGYNEMFEAMVEGCDVHLGCSIHDWKKADGDLVVYTGQLDEFYDFSLGRLGYKTLEIRTREKFASEMFPAAVVNNCTPTMYTRAADHAWWHGGSTQGRGKVTTEWPRDYKPGDIPYYPIPYGKDQRLADEYLKLAHKESVIFLGRLATYTYLNVDAAVSQVLQRLGQFT